MERRFHHAAIKSSTSVWILSAMKSHRSSANVTEDNDQKINRRSFLYLTGGGFATFLATRVAAMPFADMVVDMPPKITLPSLRAKNEAKEEAPSPSLPLSERVGFAIVGLGHLSIGQILPAFGKCKYARPVALVSGHRDKALTLASEYNIKEQSVYSYEDYDKILDNPDIKAVYIVLPNGLHAEYTIRAPSAGKHVLCEKPLSNSVTVCQQMIEACQSAKVKLMIAYRSQYEPFDRAIITMVKEKKLGDLREFVSSNSQNQGDPKQWRLNRKLAGGGPLPDVGIYCINAARFLSGEEPIEIKGETFQLPGDPRFREVESSAHFLLKFPSGFTAACSCSYSSHRSQFLRLEGSEGCAQLNPAYAYETSKLFHWHPLN